MVVLGWCVVCCFVFIGEVVCCFGLVWVLLGGFGLFCICWWLLCDWLCLFVVGCLALVVIWFRLGGTLLSVVCLLVLWLV